MLVHVMHIGAGVAPLVYFTRAKRLLKSSSVTRNRGYVKAEFRREGAKAGRREISDRLEPALVAVMSLNRIGPIIYGDMTKLIAYLRQKGLLARNMACQR